MGGLEKMWRELCETIRFHSILKVWLGAWKKDLEGFSAKTICFYIVSKG